MACNPNGYWATVRPRTVRVPHSPGVRRLGSTPASAAPADSLQQNRCRCPEIDRPVAAGPQHGPKTRCLDEFLKAKRTLTALNPTNEAATTALLNRILSQRFHYLAEGSRTYVFLSQDEQYVLKTLKAPHEIRAHFEAWGEDLSSDKYADPSGADPDHVACTMRENSMSSYRMAARSLRHETGIVHAHLAKPHSSQFIRNVRVGHHSINPNKTPFILQKRAELFGTALIAETRSLRVIRAKRKIDRLLTAIVHLWKRGFTEDTFNFHENYGIRNGRILLLDIGELHSGWERVTEEIRRKQILESYSYRWLSKRSPLSARYLEYQVHRRFNVQEIVPGANALRR